MLPAPPPARATSASPPLNATAKPPAPLAPPPQGPRSRPGSVSMLRSMHCVMARGRSCQIEQRAATRQAWRWLCAWVGFGTRWGLCSPPQRACPPTLGAHAAASPRPRAAPPLAAHPSTAAGWARVRQLPPRLARGPRAPRAARRSRARRARAPPQGPNQGRKRTAGRRRATRAATHGTAGVARGAARGVGRPPPRSPASAPSACAGREPPRRRPPARPVGVPTRRRAPAPAPTPPSRLSRRRGRQRPAPPGLAWERALAPCARSGAAASIPPSAHAIYYVQSGLVPEYPLPEPLLANPSRRTRYLRGTPRVPPRDCGRGGRVSSVKMMPRSMRNWRTSRRHCASAAG